MVEVERAKRELAEKISMIIQNIDLKYLDDLCENLIGPKDEKTRAYEEMSAVKQRFGEHGKVVACCGYQSFRYDTNFK